MSARFASERSRVQIPSGPPGQNRVYLYPQNSSILVGDSVARRKVDIRPIVGAAVVFLILGAVIFGAFYFLIIKPASDALESAKISALQTVSQLSSLGTSQAQSDASQYTTQIEQAGSESEVQAILADVNSSITREQKRLELLSTAQQAYSGEYYSAESENGKTVLSDLTNLKTTLVNDINGKTTLSALNDYESELDSKATSAWRNGLTNVVNSVSENTVAMVKQNSLRSGETMPKENALAYIENNDWTELRKVKFEPASVEVPVLDTLQRTPTLKEGSTVNVYLYDSSTQTLSKIYTSATISKVLYLDTDMQVGGTSLWENIKTLVAEGGPTSGLANFGEDAVQAAINANILRYNIQVLYVVRVADDIGEDIAKYEFHESSTKDVILIPTV